MWRETRRLCPVTIAPCKVLRSLTVFFFLAGLSIVARAWDDAASSDQAKTTYKSTCITCHGADGAGSSLGKSLKVPDLRAGEIQKKSDAELKTSVSDGKGNMPSFKNSLSPDQIQALIAYVRELGKAKAATTK